MKKQGPFSSWSSHFSVNEVCSKGRPAICEGTQCQLWSLRRYPFDVLCSAEGQWDSVGWSSGGIAGRFAFALPYTICRTKLLEIVTQENSSGDPVSGAAGGTLLHKPNPGTAFVSCSQTTFTEVVLLHETRTASHITLWKLPTTCFPGIFRTLLHETPNSTARDPEGRKHPRASAVNAIHHGKHVVTSTYWIRCRLGCDLSPKVQCAEGNK